MVCTATRITQDRCSCTVTSSSVSHAWLATTYRRNVEDKDVWQKYKPRGQREREGGIEGGREGGRENERAGGRGREKENAGESKIHREREREREGERGREAERVAGAVGEFRVRVMGKITNGAELVGLGRGEL